MNLRKVEVKVSSGHMTVNSDGKSVRVPAKYETGFFHCWEHYKSEEMSEVRAIVELEDGTVRIFDTNEIKFLDKPE